MQNEIDRLLADKFTPKEDIELESELEELMNAVNPESSNMSQYYIYKDIFHCSNM